MHSYDRSRVYAGDRSYVCKQHITQESEYVVYNLSRCNGWNVYVSRGHSYSHFLCVHSLFYQHHHSPTWRRVDCTMDIPEHGDLCPEPWCIDVRHTYIIMTVLLTLDRDFVDRDLHESKILANTNYANKKMTNTVFHSQNLAYFGWGTGCKIGSDLRGLSVPLLYQLKKMDNISSRLFKCYT